MAEKTLESTKVSFTPRKVKKDRGTQVLIFVSYLFISLFGISCIVPFLSTIAASFSSEKALMIHGFSMWPQGFSLFAYKIIFENPDIILGSYVVTIALTLVGTTLGLLFIAMAGYALQRQDFPYRNRIALFFYFTTLFSGGLVPFYLLMVQGLGLRDNYLAVLLPGLMSAWLIFLMRNFMRQIPHSITESAKIDGAGDLQILVRLIMPMATPAIATIGFFLALSYWNEWYNSMLFLSSNVRYRPLQLFLYTIVTKADFIKNSAAASSVPMPDIPLQSMKMAVAVVATGPIVVFFPFIQRFFIRGITVGAVKG
jgi:putative aldouronate transport system permease protein